MARYTIYYDLTRDGETIRVDRLKRASAIIGASSTTITKYADTGKPFNGWIIKKDDTNGKKRRKIMQEVEKRLINNEKRADTILYLVEAYDLKKNEAGSIRDGVYNRTIGPHKSNEKQDALLREGLEDECFKPKVIKTREPMKFAGGDGFCWVHTKIDNRIRRV